LLDELGLKDRSRAMDLPSDREENARLAERLGEYRDRIEPPEQTLTVDEELERQRTEHAEEEEPSWKDPESWGGPPKDRKKGSRELPDPSELAAESKAPTAKEVRGYEGTLAVGSTDLPGLENLHWEGASPEGLQPGEEFDPTFEPIGGRRKKVHTKAKNHAEQHIAGKIHRDLSALTPAQLAAGGTIRIRVDLTVCNICRAGLEDRTMRAGPLKRLSQAYPDLVIEVTADDTSEVIRIKNGARIP
jgi:hypothetical protein